MLTVGESESGYSKLFLQLFCKFEIIKKKKKKSHNMSLHKKTACDDPHIYSNFFLHRKLTLISLGKEKECLDIV